MWSTYQLSTFGRPRCRAGSTGFVRHHGSHARSVAALTRAGETGPCTPPWGVLTLLAHSARDRILVDSPAPFASAHPAGDAFPHSGMTDHWGRSTLGSRPSSAAPGPRRPPPQPSRGLHAAGNGSGLPEGVGDATVTIPTRSALKTTHGNGGSGGRTPPTTPYPTPATAPPPPRVGGGFAPPTRVSPPPGTPEGTTPTPVPGRPPPGANDALRAEATELRQSLAGKPILYPIEAVGRSPSPSPTPSPGGQGGGEPRPALLLPQRPASASARISGGGGVGRSELASGYHDGAHEQSYSARSSYGPPYGSAGGGAALYGGGGGGGASRGGADGGRPGSLSASASTAAIPSRRVAASTSSLSTVAAPVSGDTPLSAAEASRARQGRYERLTVRGEGPPGRQLRD